MQWIIGQASGDIGTNYDQHRRVLQQQRVEDKVPPI